VRSGRQRSPALTAPVPRPAAEIVPPRMSLGECKRVAASREAEKEKAAAAAAEVMEEDGDAGDLETSDIVSPEIEIE